MEATAGKEGRHGNIRDYLAALHAFCDADIQPPAHTGLPSLSMFANPPGCVEHIIIPALLITQLPRPQTNSPFLSVVIVPPGGAQIIFPNLFWAHFSLAHAMEAIKKHNPIDSTILPIIDPHRYIHDT
jgi:hypothetical protein